MTVTRRKVLTGAAGLAAATMAKPAIAQDRRRWRMVTSWPKNAPGPGTSARRLAEAITRLTVGRIEVELYGAGELVGAFEVFDAVALGQAAQIGHTASLFWSGKSSIAPVFTTAPFGLTPGAHNAWVEVGEGQTLWDELYQPFGLKPFMAGNSSMQMGGWFNRELNSLDDLKGLKVRMVGLGGEVMSRLGLETIAMPPGEIATALTTGLIEGADFLGPWSDRALGLDQAAEYYYWPGFLKPNGTAECLVNREEYEALPEDLRQAVAEACRAENMAGLADAQWNNAQALQQMGDEGKVIFRRFPEVITQAAKAQSDPVLDSRAESELDRRILDSYRAARQAMLSWDEVTHHAFVSAQLA